MKDKFMMDQLDSIKQIVDDLEFRYDLIADEGQHLIDSRDEEIMRLNDEIFEIGSLNDYLEEENKRLYAVIRTLSKIIG